MSKWPGPYEGGITQSLLTRFLQDPYSFYIYAVLGLEEPEELHPNLVWGDTFHVGLEHLIEIPCTSDNFSPEDWGEIDNAVDSYINKEYPSAPDTYPFSIKEMLRLYNDNFKRDHAPFETEAKFKKEYKTSHGHTVTLRGKYDGVEVEHREKVQINETTLKEVVSYGDTLIEHKAKGKIDPQQTKDEIPFDLQTNLYCLTSGCRHVIYDLIKIPDTAWSKPQRRAMQRPSSYVQDLYYNKQWGDFPIIQKKHLWVSQLHIHLTEESIQQYVERTIDPLIDLVCNYWEHVNDPNFDWQNPKCFNHLFYHTPIRHFDPAFTTSFKGPYWSYRTDQIDLDELRPVKSYYAELDN